jgi:aminoglycoside/choline kinase family phosphotransferase
MEELKEKLSRFLQTEDFTITPLAGGASPRKYYLLNFSKDSYFPRKDVILMYIPHTLPHTAEDYVNISYYLRRFHIAHPIIYEMNLAEGWIFVEPARGETLDHYLRQHPEEIPRIYPGLIHFLIDLQKRATFEAHCPAFQRYFDREKYFYEFDLHIRKYLLGSYLKPDMTPEEEKLFRELRAHMSEYLEEHHPVFVHRDFQTSNIFYDAQDTHQPFQIIDFQDARSGTYIYDIVSLAYDSYIDLPEDFRRKILEDFYLLHPVVPRLYSPEEYRQRVDYTIVQRKLHDAGSFVRAYKNLGNRDFLPYIEEALQMALKVMEHYPRLKPAIPLFQK